MMDASFSRRQFLSWSAAVLALSTQVRPSKAMSAHGSANDADLMMNWAAFSDQALDTFAPDIRADVAAIAETILPQTDTPGAREAGVPAFIELIFSQWMNDQEREIFELGLADLKTRAGGPFAVLEEVQRIRLLETLEAEAASHPWFQLGFESRNLEIPFIAQVKELTTVGFFMSEIGATEVLRHNHFPGYFEGDIPLEVDESTWSPTPLV